MAIVDLRTGRQRTLSADLQGVWLRSVAFTPDKSRIVGAAMDGVHVWNAATGAIAETYTGQPGRRSLMTLDPRGVTAIVGDQDGSVEVFDLSGVRRLGRFFTWNTPEQSCADSPCIVVNQQGLMATDQGDGTIALVDLPPSRFPRMTAPRASGTSGPSTSSCM